MFLKLQDSRYMQYVAAVAATLSLAASGMYQSWGSPSLLKLQSEDSPIGRPVTDEEGSWIISSFMIGTIPGPIIAGLLMEMFGRKKALLVGGVLFLVPWFMIIFGKSVVWLYIGRGIAGVANSIALLVCAIYNAEIADNDIRGKLGTTLILLKLVGSMIVLSVGPYVSYTVLGIISASMALLFLCIFIFMPESPYYFVKLNKIAKAETTIKMLSKKTSDDKFIASKLLEVEETVQKDMKNKTTVWEFLSNKEYRKSIGIILVVKSLQQLSGATAIDAYMQSIIEASGSSISSEISSIIFGVIQIPAVLTATFLVDRLGRRPLLIFSGFGCAVGLIAEGVYFYLQDAIEADVSKLGWLPTTGLAVFLVMNSLGIVPLGYVLLGELFPTNIKGIAVSTLSIYGGIGAFLAARFFKPISNAWGVYTIFWIFAGVCITMTSLLFIFLPETKGKTFTQIQEILQNKKRKEDVKTKI